MTVHARYINGNLAYWDTHRNRLIDAIGPDVFKYIDDFEISPLIAADAPLGMTVTLVEAGSGESTITKPDGSGGTLLLTTDNNDNDGINMQLAGESFGFAATQSTYAGIRFKAGEATQNDILFGLCITDTDALGGVTDGVFLSKIDGTTAITTNVEKDSSNTSTTVSPVFAASAYTIWELFWNGTALTFYIDGVLVSTPALTNLPDDELLTVTVQLLAGSAAINTMTIDWIRAISIGR